jgi:hypothetical protein
MPKIETKVVLRVVLLWSQFNPLALDKTVPNRLNLTLDISLTKFGMPGQWYLMVQPMTPHVLVNRSSQFHGNHFSRQCLDSIQRHCTTLGGNLDAESRARST